MLTTADERGRGGLDPPIFGGHICEQPLRNVISGIFYRVGKLHFV